MNFLPALELLERLQDGGDVVGRHEPLDLGGLRGRHLGQVAHAPHADLGQRLLGQLLQHGRGEVVQDGAEGIRGIDQGGVEGLPCCDVFDLEIERISKCWVFMTE